VTAAPVARPEALPPRGDASGHFSLRNETIHHDELKCFGRRRRRWSVTFRGFVPNLGDVVGWEVLWLPRP
jgi:hypothetical protein